MFSRSQLHDIIQSKQTFALISHAKPDGDALGSILGLGGLLENLGKTVNYHTPTEVPKKLQWMQGWEKISLDFRYIPYDIVIFCDEADPWKSSHSVTHGHEEYLKQQESILIDHHQQRQQYTTYSIVDTTRVSACDMLAEFLLQYYPQYINKNIATSLLTGIITDSGSFRRPSTTSQTLDIASQLMKYGADLGYIQYHYNNNGSFANLQLAKIILNRTVTLSNLIYTRIDIDEVKALGLEDEDIRSSFELIRQIPFDGACARLTVKLSDEIVPIVGCSLRSNNEGLDLRPIAGQFGGGGHKLASGCRFPYLGSPELSVQEAAKLLDQAIGEQLLTNTSGVVV